MLEAKSSRTEAGQAPTPGEPPGITVGCDAEQVQAAEALARRLDLSFAGSAASSPGTVLWVGTERTELRFPQRNRVRPFFIDFLGGSLRNRLRTSSSKEPLVRAVSARSARPPSVLDATPGLGRDAILLALAGSHMTLVERVPVLVALLEDGVRRAREQLERWARKPLSVHIEYGDSVAWIESTPKEDAPQVIYLDPMFPARSKTALVKLEMRLVREIAGESGDVRPLFEAALGTARGRVVVKRPKGAEFLCGRRPDFEIDASGVRFDVYLTRIHRGKGPSHPR